MSYASVLVYAEDNAESDQRVRLASMLASRFDARLVGITGALIGTLMPDPGELPSVNAALMNKEAAEAESRIRDVEQRFRNAAPLGKEAVEWEGSVQFPGDAVFHRSATADLIVVGRHNNAVPNLLYSALDPADVVMRCGRPVLIVPPETSSLSADRIVVAWSNTREARRAVLDALPLLRLASQVSVTEVASRNGRAAALKRVGDVAEFLLLHDVEAKPHVLDEDGIDTAERLVLHAEHENADLIVAGGYGHARAREWVFGGVTRSLMRHCPKCCLISH